MEYTDGTLSADILSLKNLKAELEELKKASMYRAGNVINVGKMIINGFISGSTKNAEFFIPLGKPIASDVTTVRVSGNFRFRQNGKYIKDYDTTYGFDTANGTDSTLYFNALGIVINVKMAGSVAFPNMTNNDCVSGEFDSIKIEFK